MRQRIPKASQSKGSPGPVTPNRDSSRQAANSSWEITSDDGGEFGGDTTNSSMTSIPMYNPLHYQSADNSMDLTAPAPSSNPLSWDAVMEAKNANAAYLRKRTSTPDTPNRRHPMVQQHPSSTGFIGLRSSHLPSLAPAFIPDSRYQSYLLGRQKQKPTSPFDKICMAKFCAYFSVIGAMFLGFVGILIDTQPMYLQGILPKHIQYTTGDRKPQVFFAVDISDRLEPASHAYRGALLYLFTACVCLGYAYNAHWWFKSKWQRYNDIPDNESTVPTFHNGLASDDALLPTSVKHQAYHQRWQSAWIAVKRLGIYLASIWPEYQERRRNRRQRFAGAKDV